MPNPHARRRFKASLFLPLSLFAATAAFGNAPGVGPTSKPVDPNDPAELLRGANEALAATRPATPATKPSTAPTAEVTANARKELDAIRDAYKALGTLKLAGTITSDIDVAGQTQKGRATFDSTFSTKGTGTGKFRHASREVAEGSTPGQDNIVLGSTGDKIYVHQPAGRVFQSTDAPKDRPTGTQLGAEVNRLLVSQNPSLLLAIVPDAAVEILDGVTKVEKGDDVRVGDQSLSSLKITAPDGVSMTLGFDPATHLLRQATTDLTESLRQKGQADANKVLFTIDYTTSEAGTAMGDDQFVWAAPLGAKDVTGKSSPPAGAMAEGPATPDAFAKNLEGKVAPDFTLKGMDGKDVKLSELKGSVVLIDFWATWCGPCVKSLPELNKTYEANKAAGLKAFAVNVKEEKDEVEAFVKETKLTIPVLLDSEGKTGDLYKYPGIPATLVVGKDGTVKRAVIGSGEKNHAALVKAIEAELK